MTLSPAETLGRGARTTMALVGGASVVAQAAMALSGLVVARTLDPTHFGQVAYFFSVYGLVVLLGSLGLSTQVSAEVARAQAAEHAGDTAGRVSALVTLRLSALVVLLALAGAALALGNLIGAAAGLAAAIALLGSFALGILQGLGRARLAAGLLAGQALLYLLVVALWAREAPERVYLAMAATATLPFIGALPQTLKYLVNPDRPWSFGRQYWKTVTAASGQVYALSLLLAPYGALALLALGGLDRFEDAASISVALSLVLLPATASSTVVAYQYYPELCRLAAGGAPNGVRLWLGAFARPLALASVTSSLVLGLGAATLIDLLYTSKYLPGAAPLVSMAPAAGLLTMGQLLAWTLVPLGKGRLALLGAGVQLALLGAAVGITITMPDLPLWILGAGHTLGSLAALVVWAFGVRRATSEGALQPLRLALAALLVAATALAVPPERLRAAAYADSTAACAGTWQPSGGSHGQLTIDCAPGFASARDRLLVFPRSQEPQTTDWRTHLNMANALWLFDAGASGRASLIIDFHPDARGAGLVADLYDDQDGDGQVAFILKDRLPAPNEGRFPTVQVRAPEGWWLRGDTVNYNLDISVNGPVQASFGSSVFLQTLRNDRTLDFELQVRDDNRDGRADYQVINAFPPLPSSSAVIRSLVMVNPKGEPPATGFLFWPHLGARVFGVVKDYNATDPPIQVNWETGRISFIGEVVSSRGGANNWFIYSLSPFGAASAYANFENPFAFYDLAGAGDGYPDLAIRQEFYGPSDPFFNSGRYDGATQLIRYSWDQDHDHTWDFKLDLIGRNPITTTVRLGALTVATVPYQEFPRWVVDNRWDIAGFVAPEPGVWTSEGIYESPVDVLSIWRTYLTGLSTGQPDVSTPDLPVGYRAQYTTSLVGQPYLYLSPVDRKLHLLKAQRGAWRLPGGKELRYSNLGGDYINHWSVLEDGQEISALALAADQMVLADAQGVRVKQVVSQEPLLVTAPPTGREEWSRLGAALRAHRPAFAPEDLSAMFRQLSGPEVLIPRASLSKLRRTAQGFRFVLTLAEAGPATVPWAAGLPPGTYTVSYHPAGGYTAQPHRPARLELGPLEVIADELAALRPVQVRTTLHNLGDADAEGVTVDLYAARVVGQAYPLIASALRAGGSAVAPALGKVSLAVLGGETAEVTWLWTPRQSGDWALRAALGESDAVSPPLQLTVAAAPSSGADVLLAAQGLATTVWIAIGLVFLAAVALAGALWAQVRLEQTDDNAPDQVSFGR